MHKVLLEGYIYRYPKIKYPVCVGGERACPPEDCGGVGGFQDFLEKLEDEPYSDESKDLREWAGLDYDPARFDRQAANAAIKRLLWNRWLK